MARIKRGKRFATRFDTPVKIDSVRIPVYHNRIHSYYYKAITKKNLVDRLGP